MMDKSFSYKFCSILSLFTLIFAGSCSAAAGCCGDSKETDSDFTLVMNYANFEADAYGDNTTTHCQCRQACYDLEGCTGYDWFPTGNPTKCWVGNDCPVTLTYDVNNQHYTTNTKLGCYSSVIKTALKWRLKMDHANFAADAYGTNKTTHCQCRQACIDLLGCNGYDWFPTGNPTKCWIGNKCPVTLTYDEKNQHFIPSTKVTCYPEDSRGQKADTSLDRLCNRELCKRPHNDHHDHHDD